MVQNISPHGIGLVLRSKIEPDQIVNIHLSHLGRNFECQVPVRIIYVEPHPYGSYVVGGVFSRKLTRKEAAGLL